MIIIFKWIKLSYSYLLVVECLVYQPLHFASHFCFPLETVHWFVSIFIRLPPLHGLFSLKWERSHQWVGLCWFLHDIASLMRKKTRMTCKGREKMEIKECKINIPQFLFGNNKKNFKGTSCKITKRTCGKMTSRTLTRKVFLRSICCNTYAELPIYLVNVTKHVQINSFKSAELRWRYLYKKQYRRVVSRFRKIHHPQALLPSHDVSVVVPKHSQDMTNFYIFIF